MAPRAALTQAEKLERVLTYFHDSATCHTLKDLETTIPAATKINKMQVKDLIKELTDTNQVKVEKIGTGNWYWAWAGEELAGKIKCVARLEAEQKTLQDTIRALETQTSSIHAQQVRDDIGPEHTRLLQETDKMKDQVKDMIIQREAWEKVLTENVESKRLAVTANRSQVTCQNDNIDALEAYLQSQLPIGKEEMDALRKECYGDLWQEESRLDELDIV